MLSLSMLGPLQVTLNGEPVTGFKTNKMQALFCYLALTKEPHSRHALAGLLWSDDPEDKAKNSLRVALNNLNARFADYLHISRLTVAFNVDAPHTIDVDAFVELTQSLAFDTPCPDMETMQAAAALYRGDLLCDLHIDDAPAFAEWLTEARLRQRQTARALFDALATARLEQHEYGAAVPVLEQLLQLDPNHEDAHRQLMITHGRLGNYDAALAQYETSRRILQQALNVQPMPETTALYERIRAAQTQRVQTLPPIADRFVGRTVELQQIENLLLNPDCRLISITGLGGVGKTRLAMAAIHQIHTEQTLLFLNGVVFVPLVGVATVDQLPTALAAALNLTLAGKADPAAQLLDYLQNKELLLVLDNFEHLMEGIDLISDILQMCPDVKFMVTSREPLYVEAEWRLHLDGLPHPVRMSTPAAAYGEEANTGPHTETNVHAAQQYEAVRLLLQTAHRVDESYQLTAANVNAVCRLCELAAGNPLAIELATRWLRVMPIDRIVQEIERSIDLLATDAPDWPQRQRSMRAILDYTYGLLSLKEQYILRDLSIFRGGFSEEAAAEVADASPYLLAGLIDRGLLHLVMGPAGARYTIHELTRQYVAEKLDATDLAALQRAHSQFFAQQVAGLAQSIRTETYRTAIAAIATDLDNIHAAWRWLLDCVRRGEDVIWALDALARCAPTMADYFHATASLQPGKQFFRWAVTAVKAPEEAGCPDPLRQQRQTVLAQLQVRLAWFHLELAEYDAVDRLAADALPPLQRAECTADIALLLTLLGRSNIRRGVLDAADEQLQKSIELYAAIGDLHGQSYAMRSYGMKFSSAGNYAQARAIYAEARTLCESIGYTRGVAQIVTNVGSTYARDGDHAQALPFYQQALAMAEAEADRQMQLVALSNVGSAQRGLGNHGLAETFAKRSLSMARELSNRRWIAANLQILSQIYLETYDLTAAARSAQEGVLVAHDIGSAPDALGCLSILAHAWAHRSQIDDALCVLFFVEHHPAAMARDKRYNAQLVDELRQELPPALLEEAEEWSRRQSLDDIIEWLTARSAQRIAA